LASVRVQRNFEELLSEAVDEGLASLGQSAKQAMYYYLETVSNLNKQEIPYKVKDFAAAIEKFFGLGSNFLEIIILKQLYEKVGEPLDLPSSEDLNFSKCVEHVRKAKHRKAKQSEIKI